MTITQSINAERQRVLTIPFENQKDVDATNVEVHNKLERLLSSLSGRSYFTGGTVAIIDNSTLHVSVDLRPVVDNESATEAFRKAFFSA